MTAIYRFQVRAVVGEQLFVNNLHFRTKELSDSPMSSGDMLLACTTLTDRWALQIVPFLHESYVLAFGDFTEVDGWYLWEDPDGIKPDRKRLILTRNRRYFPATTQQGLVTGDPLPNTIAAVVQLNTDRIGRRRRGRLKLGPYAESQNTGNEMTAGLHTSLNTGVNLMLADVTIAGMAGPLESVVFSPTSLLELAAPGDPYSHCTPIINGTVTYAWGTQRTRKFDTSAH